jgi:hypothetical protein
VANRNSLVAFRSKGNHIWTIEAKKVSDDKWTFRRFERRIVPPSSKVARIGVRWTYEPKVFDPQSPNIAADFSSPALPPWLQWRPRSPDGKTPACLQGVPPPGAPTPMEITIIATWEQNNRPMWLELKFDLRIVGTGAHARGGDAQSAQASPPTLSDPSASHEEVLDAAGLSRPASPTPAMFSPSQQQQPQHAPPPPPPQHPHPQQQHLDAAFAAQQQSVDPMDIMLRDASELALLPPPPQQQQQPQPAGPPGSVGQPHQFLQAEQQPEQQQLQHHAFSVQQPQPHRHHQMMPPAAPTPLAMSQSRGPGTGYVSLSYDPNHPPPPPPPQPQLSAVDMEMHHSQPPPPQQQQQQPMPIDMDMQQHHQQQQQQQVSIDLGALQPPDLAALGSLPSSAFQPEGG